MSINVDSENTVFSSLDGVLFNKNQTTLLIYPASKTNDSYTIPDGVANIDMIAFRYSTNLVSVTIPDSITSIGTSAFANCASLTSIIFKSEIPPSFSSTNVFEKSYALTEIIVPNSAVSAYQKTSNSVFARLVRCTICIMSTSDCTKCGNCIKKDFAPTCGNTCPKCNPCLIISEVKKTESSHRLIEIHNPTDKAVSTKGLFITDDDELFKWQMPSFIIRPNQSILIKGVNDNITTIKRGMVNFDVSSAEKVLLTASDEKAISEAALCNDCGKCTEYTFNDIIEMNKGNDDFQIRYDNSGNIIGIWGNFDDVTITDYESAFVFICSLRKVLNIKDPSRILREVVYGDYNFSDVWSNQKYARSIGRDYYWFNQHEKDILVFTSADSGAQEYPRGLCINTTGDGKVTSIVFSTPILDLNGMDIDITPVLSVDDLKKIYNDDITTPYLIIFTYGDYEQNPQLAYIFEAPIPTDRPWYDYRHIISAVDGRNLVEPYTFGR
jgi:ferredoxin